MIWIKAAVASRRTVLLELVYKIFHFEFNQINQWKMFSNRQMRVYKQWKFKILLIVFSRHTHKYDARLHSFVPCSFCPLLEQTNCGHIVEFHDIEKKKLAGCECIQNRNGFMTNLFRQTKLNKRFKLVHSTPYRYANKKWPPKTKKRRIA